MVSSYTWRSGAGPGYAAVRPDSGPHQLRREIDLTRRRPNGSGRITPPADERLGRPGTQG